MTTETDSEDEKSEGDSSQERRAREGSVEDRIVGEFMRKTQETDVGVEIMDVMEGRIHEDDFGGEEVIVNEIEEAVLDNEDR